jgi:uncharacterized repeat protein (TIGR02543 family)
MIMGKRTNQGLTPLLIVLAILLAGCTNPFFAKLLDQEEEPGSLSYTVAFKLNDGTANNHTVKTALSGSPVLDFPGDPTRGGYTFAEWKDGAGNVFTASTIVNGDITVYAQWTAIPPGSYTVTFKLNDSTANNHAVKTAVSGSPVTDFPGDPARDGYTFAEWKDDEVKIFYASSFVNGDITVYAQWTAIPPDSYTVTFKLNDGTTDNHAVKTAVSGSTVTDFPGDPTRGGHTFTEWKDGAENIFTASTIVNADITVYAQWTVMPSGGVITLYFDAGGGAFNQTGFTVYRSGGTGSQTVNMSGSGYANPRWEVDGDLKGTGTGITINAADYGVGGISLPSS